MKLLRALGISILILIPTAALAAATPGSNAKDCCPSPCCPDC
ncbi:MAG TPA: hypothetical protein VIU61_19935 [Kofleriaceae bacterium]